MDELPIPQSIRVSPRDSDITITASQFQYKMHRDLPAQTLWGYNGTSPGPTIEVESGQSVRVHWKDQLPTTHLFPMPKGMDMDPSMPDVRMVTHLHGAVVSESDITDRFITATDGPMRGSRRDRNRSPSIRILNPRARSGTTTTRWARREETSPRGLRVFTSFMMLTSAV